jgi:hypothetical protein
MSFIDIEYDKLVLSTSPLLNTFYFPKKFYRLYQSTKTDDNIIINGSFLFNETNEKYLCNSPVAIKKNGINDFNFIEEIPYYKNIEKLFIHFKNTSFYIDIDKLEIEIENSSSVLDNIVYQSNIKKIKNIKHRDFVIMSLNPVLINVSYDIKLASNFVRISCINDTGYGGSADSYLYDKNHQVEIKTLNCIQTV